MARQPQDMKVWQGIARTKMADVRKKLAEASLFVGQDDPLRAFQAAEEAYMFAFDVKDFIDREMTRRLAKQPPAYDPEVNAGPEPYRGPVRDG